MGNKKGVVIKKALNKAGVLVITISLLVPTGKAVAEPLMGKDMVARSSYSQLGEMKSFSERDVKALSSSFTDLPSGHWAQSAVSNAVNHGYVSGYPDGSFKPNREVSRAEFLSMLVRSQDLELRDSDIWYEPFVWAAEENGILNGDFSDYGKEMSRAEMALVSVRALGQEVDDLYEAMLEATSKGLITGVDSEGNLDMWGTTTRAQSVAIIQRILKAQRGEELVVDYNAVKKAEEQMEDYEGGQGGEFVVKDDPWGHEIRTTNLPKNWRDYPYILEDVPNEVYEMEMHKAGRGKDQTPYDVWYNSGDYSLDLVKKELIDMGFDKINEYYNTILNVDWRTIEDDWGQDIIEHVYFLKPEQRDRAKEALIDYVKYVRDNKIAFEGSFEAHPTMMYEYDGSPYLRSKVEFKIKEIGNPEVIERNPDGSVKSGIVYYERYDYNIFEIGKKYTMWTDVSVVRNSPWMGGLHPVVYLEVHRPIRIFTDYLLVSEE